MHDRDCLHRFLFEHYPIRGHIVHLDASWRALLEHREYPSVIRDTLGEAVAASVLLAATMKFDGTLSGSLAKQVFEVMLETGQDAGVIVEERGLKQTSDTGAIDAEIDQIFAANADKVAEYKAGKQALFGFFVGQVMKAMAGKANPGVVNERLRAKLGG